MEWALPGGNDFTPRRDEQNNGVALLMTRASLDVCKQKQVSDFEMALHQNKAKATKDIKESKAHCGVSIREVEAHCATLVREAEADCATLIREVDAKCTTIVAEVEAHCTTNIRRAESCCMWKKPVLSSNCMQRICNVWKLMPQKRRGETASPS